MAAKCLYILKVCKRAGERQAFAVNWTDEFARLWQSRLPFTAGVCIRPSADLWSGYEYFSGGGVSGLIEPEWGTDPIVDGSITWTPQAISASSLRYRINGASVWTPDGSGGLDLEGEETTDTPALQQSRIFTVGGVAGHTYSNIVTVTTIPEAAIYQAELRVKIDP